MEDLKELYQEKAEEISLDERGAEFEELSKNEKNEVYGIAIKLVGEELQGKTEKKYEDERI